MASLLPTLVKLIPSSDRSISKLLKFSVSWIDHFSNTTLSTACTWKNVRGEADTVVVSACAWLSVKKKNAARNSKQFFISVVVFCGSVISKKIAVFFLCLLNFGIIGKNIGFSFSNANIVFKVYGRLTIFCPHRPTVVFGIHLFFAQVDHGLDGNYQPFFHHRTGTAFAVVRNLRIFVHA